MKSIARILRSYLSESPEDTISSPQISLLLDIFISSVLELLGDISFMNSVIISENLIEVVNSLISIDLK